MKLKPGCSSPGFFFVNTTSSADSESITNPSIVSIIYPQAEPHFLQLVPTLAPYGGYVAVHRFRDAKELPPRTVRGRLADDVRKKRNEVGLSQAAFASACNVPLRTFKRFEAGNCDSMLVLIKILQAFGRFDGFDLLFEEARPVMEARTLLAVEARLQAKVAASRLKEK